MFKLLSKKKKGVIQCPLCKTEVTKRSLKENSRFKQLVEGLLETIRAFELDTGINLLNSHRFPKAPAEATAPEFLCKESSVIQSKGFRNRRKSAKDNGQENCTVEAEVDMQLADTRVTRHPLRNDTQKCNPEKGIYIEFGSDSSEEHFKQAGAAGLEGTEALQMSSGEKPQELKSAENEDERSCNAQPDKLGAEETVLPNVVGESDVSREGSSKKSAWSSTEHAEPGRVNTTEYQSSPLNVLAVDLLTERCDQIGDASALRKGDTSFAESTDETDAEQTPCNEESKDFDLNDSSETRSGKSKETPVVQSVEAVEMCEPENDSFHEKEVLLEKPLQPESLHCATEDQVSRKRLKRSIQKVNEWFSKSNEILPSNSSQDDSAGATDVSGEGETCLSDKDSCISEKTDPMVDCTEIAVVEGNERWSKQTADSIKDKIFGKTYKRDRKSNPPVTLREILPTTKKEGVVAAPNCLNSSSKGGLKRKRKTARVLQPEDFIKKKGTEEAGGCPQSADCGLGGDGGSAVHESCLSENREDPTLGELAEGGGSMWKKATEKVTGKHCAGELEPNNCDQTSTKKTPAKRCRRSARAMCALQLVVDRSYASPDPAESQIDSYPSSEEPRNVDSEQRQVRRSRRLQLLVEEMTKETGRGVVIKGARNDSGHEGSSSGVQRNALAHTSECQDLCEPQGMRCSKAPPNLKGIDLEANEVQISLKNSSRTARPGESLFSPPSCQHSDRGAPAPDAGSPEGEVLGSPFLLQPPSVPVVQTASHPTAEMAGSRTAFPQDNEHDTQNVPGDFTTAKLPAAKNVLGPTKEAEDSELDTQYLRNIFRHSKRASFSLYPAPVKACAEDAASETSKIRADPVENDHSKYSKPENLREEETPAENLSGVWEKEELKGGESGHVSAATGFVSSRGCVRAGQHREAVPQVASRGNLTPVRTDTAGAEGKNRPQKGEQGNTRTVSADVGMGSELRQNPVKRSRSKAEGQVFQSTDLNTVDEGHFSSESNAAGKAGVVGGKGPTLHLPPQSTICPAACERGAAEVSGQVIGGKSERKPVKRNDVRAARAGPGVSECLTAEALEEPLKGKSDFTGLSETPDGLLCSDGETEENTSFSEADKRERSAVFVKSDSALVREPLSGNVSSKPRSRRRVQKLPSSDEESSEDNFPSFQTLLFGKPASTPLQVSKQGAAAVESSVCSSTLPRRGHRDDNVLQEVAEPALSSRCVSLSQESECSVNLFSSQSNVSEESADGAQELRTPLIQVPTSHQASNVSEGKETFRSSNGGLKRSRTNVRDDCQDPNTGANLGEVAGYDSETSYVEDSCGPLSQGEILTTQQKNAMQNNLRKLQQEMAVLEAALKQHGSQDCELPPIRRELPHASSEGTLGMEQMGQERGAASASEGNFESHKCSSSSGFPANDFHVMPSDSLNSKTKELKERSPELLVPSSKCRSLGRTGLEKGPRCDGAVEDKAPAGMSKPAREAVQEDSQHPIEAAQLPIRMGLDTTLTISLHRNWWKDEIVPRSNFSFPAEHAGEEQCGTRLNSASILSSLSGNVTRSPSSSSVRLLNPAPAEAASGSAAAQNAGSGCAQECKAKGSVCVPVSVARSVPGKENATGPAVSVRREMSIVASGLNPSEQLVVQKFARRTRSTLSNHVTEGTTHVIMKTDEELVCERTLKYFLGIAGRRWVVSYLWVIQSFREGRILDEENFEVRGDVINGRNHQGPKRARQALTEKIFKDFEICCYGPFTGMTTGHLEWMVELCGAAVVKQPHLFAHKPNSTAVVVVQPDAWMEDTDCGAIQQKNNVAVVTREWVLDSVACYDCQELDAYLVS
ncbi:breast cancer type 1 susceptibility protein [Rhynochetos jubatus]